MKNEFVPYEEALTLKELGFDEECLGWSLPDNKDMVVSFCAKYTKQSKNKKIQRPLYQQVFRWFRKQHQIETTVACYYNNKLDMSYEERMYHCYIVRDGITTKGPKFKTYEEAELACLKKLIEIVKQNKDE